MCTWEYLINLCKVLNFRIEYVLVMFFRQLQVLKFNIDSGYLI